MVTQSAQTTEDEVLAQTRESSLSDFGFIDVTVALRSESKRVVYSLIESLQSLSTVHTSQGGRLKGVATVCCGAPASRLLLRGGR